MLVSSDEVSSYPAQPPIWKATPCRLSATDYSIYAHIPSISGGRYFPQFKTNFSTYFFLFVNAQFQTSTSNVETVLCCFFHLVIYFKQTASIIYICGSDGVTNKRNNNKRYIALFPCKRNDHPVPNVYLQIHRMFSIKTSKSERPYSSWPYRIQTTSTK
jgi:hypothetical protein